MSNYKIVSELGRGGMGVVYRALQMPLEREVAMKFLLGDHLNSPDVAKRFHREVMACTKLQHPNIIKILDSGETDGRQYYVMEFLGDAVPLDQLIKNEGPFAPERAIRIAIQLLEALDYCHVRNFIHRDLKPPNIMIRPGDHAVLMDFGLARDLAATTMLTAEGRAIGTPRFMSPEMFRGEEATGLADVWALGATLYEMLTKTRAFTGKSYSEIAISVLRTDPPPLHTLVASLPLKLDEVVRKFLKRDPAERVPTARKGVRILRDWLGEPDDAAAPRRPSRKVLVSKVTAVPAPPAASRVGPVFAGMAAITVFAGIAFRSTCAPAPSPSAASPAPAAAAMSSATPSSGPALEEAAARLRSAIERLEPRRLIDELARDMRPAWRVRNEAARKKKWEPDRARWESRLRAALAGNHLEKQAEAFGVVRDRLYSNNDLNADAKLAVYAAVHLERELEEEARSAGIAFPPIAKRLYSPEYGLGAKPRASAAGVLISLLIPPPAARDVGAGSPFTAYTSPVPQDHFFDYDTGSAPNDMVGQVGHVAYEHAGAVELSGPLVQLRASVETIHAEDSFQILFARTRPTSPRDWRLLAILTPEKAEAHQLCHSVPAGLVPAGPIFIKIAFAASPRSRRMRADQDGRLKWLLLSCMPRLPAGSR